MRLHLCRYGHEWPEDDGYFCPQCKGASLQTFTRIEEADGVCVDVIDGGGSVGHVDLTKAKPGTYLDGEFFLGDFDEAMDHLGFPEDSEDSK